MRQFLTIFILFISSVTFLENSVQAQNFSFECNTLPDLIRSENDIDIHYSSIDTSIVDFELKLWHYRAGLAGASYRIFVFRHYSKNQWKAFYFNGDKKNRKPKTMTQFYSQFEIPKNKLTNPKSLWDTLTANNILAIAPPSPGTLSRLLNANNPSYPTVVMGVSIDDDTDEYTLELINKKCRRITFWNYSYLSLNEFTQVPEIKYFNEILNALNKQLSNF